MSYAHILLFFLSLGTNNSWEIMCKCSHMMTEDMNSCFTLSVSAWRKCVKRLKLLRKCIRCRFLWFPRTKNSVLFNNLCSHVRLRHNHQFSSVKTCFLWDTVMITMGCSQRSQSIALASTSHFSFVITVILNMTPRTAVSKQQTLPLVSTVSGAVSVQLSQTKDSGSHQTLFMFLLRFYDPPWMEVEL